MSEAVQQRPGGTSSPCRCLSGIILIAISMMAAYETLLDSGLYS